MPDYNADRQEAILWAQSLLSREDWVIYDCETTSLRMGEIVQIGLLSACGEELMDTLVCPRGWIPPEATAIHGITDEMVKREPLLEQLLPLMEPLMFGKEVVVFNVGFDKPTLHNAIKRRRDGVYADWWIQQCSWTCAMRWYSQCLGSWSDYHGNYRWQPLPGGDHSAIGDCRATLDVIKMMAEAK